MKQWYEVKIRAVVGPDPGDDKEVRILGRTLVWEKDVLKYEGDDKHVRTILDELGFDENSKGVEVPINKDHDDEDGEVELLDAVQRGRCRRLAATINYMAKDRPDLQFAASVLGRSMSNPSVKSWMNLKKVARYLQAHPRVIYEYHRVTMTEVQELIAFSDSDWAGCRTSRRSTSGGLVVLGGGVMQSWSNRQATIALSSGEAEYYAAAKAAAELLAMQSHMMHLGWHVVIQLCVDAEVARAMASRRRIGRVRHLQIRHLWLQECVKAGAMTVRKVAGQRNPADVLTKVMSFEEAMGKLKGVNVC
jgi:hypothetical protein